MISLARNVTATPHATAAWALLVCGLPIGYAATQRPVAVLLGLAAVAVVVVCTIRIELAVLLLIGTAPLEFAITIGSSSQLTITKLAGAVCFVSFALNTIVTRRRLIFDLTHGLVFLLLGIALLSMAQAEDLPSAIRTATRYASFVALFFVVSQFIGTQRLQRRMVWVLSLASSVTGILALSHFLSGASLQARLPHGDPNDIAFVLATTLPFTIWLFRERGIRRIAVGVMVGLIAVSILLTLSRGALVGLGAGLAWYTLFERRNSKALLAGAVMIGLALLLVVRLDQHRIEEGLRAKRQVASTNVATRLEAWNAAARLAVAHPLLGIGPGNFRDYYFQATGHPPGTKSPEVVHDAYLDVAAELGIIAMVAFVIYLVFAFARLTVAVRYQLGPPGFATACRVSLVVAVCAALTLSEQYFVPFWLLGALATALYREAGREPRTA